MSSEGWRYELRLNKVHLLTCPGPKILQNGATTPKGASHEPEILSKDNDRGAAADGRQFDNTQSIWRRSRPVVLARSSLRVSGENCIVKFWAAGLG